MGLNCAGYKAAPYNKCTPDLTVCASITMYVHKMFRKATAKNLHWSAMYTIQVAKLGLAES